MLPLQGHSPLRDILLFSTALTSSFKHSPHKVLLWGISVDKPFKGLPLAFFCSLPLPQISVLALLLLCLSLSWVNITKFPSCSFLGVKTVPSLQCFVKFNISYIQSNKVPEWDTGIGPTTHSVLQKDNQHIHTCSHAHKHPKSSQR